jgi:hypothetical protein
VQVAGTAQAHAGVVGVVKSRGNEDSKGASVGAKKQANVCVLCVLLCVRGCRRNSTKREREKLRER